MNLPRRLAATTAVLGATALGLGCVAGCGHSAAAPESAAGAVRPAATASGSSAAATASGAAASGSRPAATTGPARHGGRHQTGWRERTVVREDQHELTAAQVVDPAAGALYALVPQQITPVRDPYALFRTGLANGPVRKSPAFADAGIALASGYLWIFSGRNQQASRSAPLVVREVSPRTLAVVRSVALPPLGRVSAVSVAAGPGDSVWIGDSRAAWRVSAATGAVLARVTVPARFAVADVAVDPAGRHLYVSALDRRPQGGPGAVFEYAARSGRLLASAERGPVTFALAGAALTATPPGVWASYRTGMLGSTILLRRRGLVTVLPPGHGLRPGGPRSVYVWPMGATTVYGGGSFWVANEAGVMACASPRTGVVRARMRTRQASLAGNELLAVDASAHLVYGLGQDGLIAISPPARCWR
jgi:hypothetical protein